MKKAEKIIEILKNDYPEAQCELNHKTPFQLLIATVLSAQTTDKSVNKVTATLFKEYPDLNNFLKLSQKQIEDKIRKIGLYRNKSKSIYNLCKYIKENFNGQVPKTMDELIKLPGVGRKTASVVLAVAYNIPAFPVDTHVFRITKRIGIASGNTPDKVSDEVMKELPKDMWIDAHHIFIFHGRQTCLAKTPKCYNCSITNYCDYFKLNDN